MSAEGVGSSSPATRPRAAARWRRVEAFAALVLLVSSLAATVAIAADG